MIIFDFLYLLICSTQPNYDEDMVDRFNNRVLSYALIATGLTVFGYNFGGTPIECWGKPECHPSWHQYAEDYCFNRYSNLIY